MIKIGSGEHRIKAGPRNKLPKNISIPKFPKINETSHTKKLKPIIEKEFKNHPGSTNNFWFATEYEDVVKLLNFFIKEKSNLFGDYEDAVDQKGVQITLLTSMKNID